MGLSHHADEYNEMQQKFIEMIDDYIGDRDDAVSLTSELFSIMNDYGAVDWT